MIHRFWALAILACLMTASCSAINRESASPSGGTVNATDYYLDDAGGSDSNDGKTALTAWKTLEKLNAAVLQPGDKIHFKRGGVWRGQIKGRSGSPDKPVVFAAYGSGNKPQILGSRNKNSASDWTNSSGNIWICTERFLTDIGNAVFNNGALIGKKKWSPGDLGATGDYCYDRSSSNLFLYCAGNPALSYTDIELALRRHVVDFQNTSNTIYENLELRYGGAHGFGGANTRGLVIRDCDISWIGGGDIDMDGSNVRFGNGIEFWAHAYDNLVERCRIWEIYDTGLTAQNHTATVTQKNIVFRNNLVWNCGLSSFEYWNRPAASVTSNIVFEHNTCVWAGAGWGQQRPDTNGGHVVFYFHDAETHGIHIRNNIFDIGRYLMYIGNLWSGIETNLFIDYNCWHQTNGGMAMMISGSNYSMTNWGGYLSYSGKDSHSITNDPQFQNAPGLDFNLAPSSACVNAGTNTGVTADFVGNPRPTGGTADMGALEYQ